MANAFQFRSLLGMSQSPSAGEAKGTAGNVLADDGQAPTLRANRKAQVRENLDVLMRQVEHARHDADQMMDEMSALELDAGQAAALRRENGALREQLDDTAREVITETTKAQNADREIARLKDELERIRQDFEKSSREASANALDAERIEDRLRATMASLDETKHDLEGQREAKDKAEVDVACLRANLTERDRAQNTLMQQETELRMQVAKLQSQYAEVTETLARKERSVLEKSSELDITKNRIADLEAEADTAREELRILNGKYADLKVSQEARLFSLNEGLNDEREGHRVTRKLLDEARASGASLNDENASLKDQSMMNSRDVQKLKRELSSTRSQVHDYSDKLKEAHLQIASAHSDIQRLEGALDDAKKDAVSLRRQANKSDQLLRENTELNDKIANLQQTLDRYRHKSPLDDMPIMLSTTKRSSPPAPKKSKAPAVAAPNQNVARIRRR